jgi:serine protease Do
MQRGSAASALVGLLGITLLTVPSHAPGGDADGEPAGGAVSVPAAFSKAAPEGVDDLKAMQDHFRALARRVAPATVVVRRDGEAGAGSGVIVSQDGFILSVAHVAGEAGSTLTVLLPDGRKMRAKTLEVDRAGDMALIKTAEEGGYPFVRMGRSADLGRGQWCIALGYPGGALPPPVLRVGRVMGRQAAPVRGGLKVIFTDCVIEGGDSGGPLFDLEGRVIGIHSVLVSAVDGNGHMGIEYYRAAWGHLIEGRRAGFPDPHPGRSETPRGSHSSVACRPVVSGESSKTTEMEREGSGR